MTDHQRERRARKSKAHFAKCAERAAMHGDKHEAERLLFWAQRKRALANVLRAAFIAGAGWRIAA